LPFGGVHPGVQAAMKHVEQGARVWSTNVGSHCAIPGCIIESVFSFKLSANFNEILSGTPAEAKKILQQEKLNYFLVSREFQLSDVLPFSHLFSLKNIGKYFGIKWTDGTTYLLTWKENTNTPIGPEFLALYKDLLARADHPWFRFREFVPELNYTMKLLENSPHPWKPIAFRWEAEDQVKH
jgi:hypothetical protein